MIICVDAGNTNISIALYKSCNSSKLLLQKTIPLIPKDINQQILTLFSQNPPQSNSVAVVSSVLSKKTFDAYSILKSMKIHKIITVSSSTVPWLEYKVKNPNLLGADRIASAVAAATYFPTTSSVIVDFGTATTVNFLHKAKTFLGGAILPGIHTMAKSLNEQTDKLPMITDFQPKTIIGTDTKSAITSGIIYGSVGAVLNIIEEFEQTIGEYFHLIITGGNARYIVKHIKKYHLWIPDLIFTGMKIIACKQTK